MSRLSRLLSPRDFEQAALRRLPKAVFGYVHGGTEDEKSLLHNRAAFDAISLKPRGFVGIAGRSQTIELWGNRYASPIGIAPMGVTAICARNCDLLLARTAQRHKIPYVLSGASTFPLEKMQKQVGNVWYQGYLPGDIERLRPIVKRLRNAGVTVLVVTGDTPIAANRENNIRNGFTIPFKISPSLVMEGLMHPRWSLEVFLQTLVRDGVPRFVNLSDDMVGSRIIDEPKFGFRGGRDLLNWEHISWLRDNWDGKLVVKGLLHPSDAEEVIRRGLDAMIISNHGGRQLDSTVAPIRVLSQIVGVVKQRLPIFIDSGFRRGTDVIKAIAMGAKLVFIGRSVLYGAVVGGEKGADRVVELLMSEVNRDLGLVGCKDIGELSKDYLEP